MGLVAYGSAGRGNESGPEPMPFIVLPQKGKAQQWRILQALATVRAGGNWPLARVLAEMDRNLGRGVTVAVITPSCEPEWVSGLLPPMRRGVAPVVILLDPDSFTGQEEVDGNKKRVEAMAGLLADLGIPSHRVVQGMPFEPIVKHRPSGPEYKVLPGTGRVIRIDR